MRLVTKDLKCLGCSSGKYSDSRHLLSEEEGRSFSQKANIVRRFHYFAPRSHFSFLDPDAFRPFPLVKDIVGYLKMCHSILPIKR